MCKAVFARFRSASSVVRRRSDRRPNSLVFCSSGAPAVPKSITKYAPSIHCRCRPLSAAPRTDQPQVARECLPNIIDNGGVRYNIGIRFIGGHRLCGYVKSYKCYKKSRFKDTVMIVLPLTTIYPTLGLRIGPVLSRGRHLYTVL